ncbi:alpha/beta fold hydrolase [Cryobacterium psychrophilum]|uniref:Alpha/beta fold hydrolase n=1 Tax=Cryobacterium psychrophilum TaxID=41988 RepID=A0A4Y8KUY2_9MICO|nr:alpha/beta hydrolase [Cryobacterium psychrophilum]TDW28877.1 pimeloyl-ACP methyl ester carboxylesterase [Cryobacterium psychrophilum]TFD81071.1 alpha/beta fold hydrolase [Cryobacterium psychrophilum]
MGNRRISAATIGVALVAASFWPARHFHSGRVRRWRRGAGAPGHAGRLGVRVFGHGHPVLALLPGIGASQAFFGAAYDRLGEVATVVVIDPLGFGASMDAGVSSDSFGLEEHLAAITGALGALGLDGRPLHVAGHSMGASLAIQWAAASEGDIRTVVAFDAPLYRNRAEADERVRHMGWFEALLSTGPRAHAMCAWMCRHRSAAAVLAVALNPAMPVAIARDGVKHTWFSYIQSFEAIVAADTWIGAIAALSGRGVSVLLVDGKIDPVPVPGRARELATEFASVTARTHRGGHDLPLASPGWCSDLLYRQVAAA